MKQLHEYETPENQRLTDYMNGSDDQSHLLVLDKLSRDLERRLAACREALERIQRHGVIMGITAVYRDGQIDAFSATRNIAEETLALTAPKQ